MEREWFLRFPLNPSFSLTLNISNLTLDSFSNFVAAGFIYGRDSCSFLAVKGMLKCSPFFTLWRNVVLHLLLFSVSRALWTFYTDLCLPLTLILHSLLTWFSSVISRGSGHYCLYRRVHCIMNNVWSQSPLSPGVLTLLTSDCVRSPVPAPERTGRANPASVVTSTRHRGAEGEPGTGFCRGER